MITEKLCPVCKEVTIDLDIQACSQCYSLYAEECYPEDDYDKEAEYLEG